MEFIGKHVLSDRMDVYNSKKFKPEVHHWIPFMELLSNEAMPCSIHRTIGDTIKSNPTTEYLTNFLEFVMKNLNDINKDFLDLILHYVHHAINLLPIESLHSLGNNLLSQYSSVSKCNIFFKLLLLFPEIKWDFNITEQFSAFSLVTPSNTKSTLLKLVIKPSFLSSNALKNLKVYLAPLVRSSNPEILQYAIPLFSKSAQLNKVLKEDVIVLQDILYGYPCNGYDQEIHGEVLGKAIDAIGDLALAAPQFTDGFVEDLFDFVGFFNVNLVM